jgi:hypothetical protein
MFQETLVFVGLYDSECIQSMMDLYNILTDIQLKYHPNRPLVDVPLIVLKTKVDKYKYNHDFWDNTFDYKRPELEYLDRFPNIEISARTNYNIFVAIRSILCLEYWSGDLNEAYHRIELNEVSLFDRIIKFLGGAIQLLH